MPLPGTLHGLVHLSSDQDDTETTVHHPEGGIDQVPQVERSYRVLDRLGVEVVFTSRAVVIAMAVMGFPLLVRTARAGFEQVTRRYEQIAETLGANAWRVFSTITLPLASRNILAGALLGFSRALGEFGATIVVAGSIPGRTRTLAVGIYSFTETGQDRQAAMLLVVSIAIAFTAVLISNRLAGER